MKNIKVWNLVFCILGVLFIGLGAAICNVGQVGVDPFSSANIAVSTKLNISLGIYQLGFNLILILFVLKLHKSLIGFGTIISMIAVGFAIEFFTFTLSNIFTSPVTMPVQVISLIAGVMILSLGVSLYMSADMGVAPYDALALIAKEKYHQNFVVWRVIFDLLSVIIGFVLGGPVGIGTIIFAFFIGPFIAFYNVRVSLPLLQRLQTQKS